MQSKGLMYAHCNTRYSIHIQVYIMMSEKCHVDYPHKSCSLLDKANKCIEEAMQRTDDDSVC